MSEVEIDDTTVLLGLTGPRGERLKALERELSIECGLRGNTIFLRGPAEASRSPSGSSRGRAAASQSGVEVGAHDVRPRAPDAPDATRA